MRRWLAGWICTAILSAQTAGAQEQPVFRSETQLVQTNVVAQDKNGKPITDLRRDEFRILDNGSPQEIRLFVAETERAGASVPEHAATKAPAQIFTNRLASGEHSGYSVILIDSLFTDFGDPFKEPGSATARLQALRALRSIPAGERVAIYALGRKLQVICEFTPDRALLERQLQQWASNADTPATSLDVPREADESGRMALEVARIDSLRRASSSSVEMDQLAGHLTGISGRKKLIWLSNRFVIDQKTLRKLNDAGIAIYPVDVDGACICSNRPKDLMRDIAGQTGGVAYFGRNDLDAAIHEAMEDGQVNYTLGFYSPGDEGASKVHSLAVSVARSNITLRYRTSYQPQSLHAGPSVETALNEVLDASGIPVTASVWRAQDQLDVEALLDAASLDLTPDRSLWSGRIEVVARFTTADGRAAGATLHQTLALKLRQGSYEAALQGGFGYHNRLTIPAKAVQLKLLFANQSSGRTGTVTIPLSEVAAQSHK